MQEGVKAALEEVLQEEMTQHLQVGYREPTATGRGERSGHYTTNLLTPAGKFEAGVEGTGSYGAGPTRRLRAVGTAVMEVEGPMRRRRGSRRNDKSDSQNAELAARAVLTGEPKSADGRVEMIRVLKAARRSGAVTRKGPRRRANCSGVLPAKKTKADSRRADSTCGPP